MNVTTTAAPPFEPVTLADCYTHLRLDPDGSPLEHPDDAMLRRHIVTSRETVEKLVGRSLVQRTLRLSTASWPQHGDGIRLYRAPVLRVTGVQFLDADNAMQTLDAAEWYVTDDELPDVRFTAGFSRPMLYDRPDAVRISYVAGYPPAGSPPDSQADYSAAVPDVLKDAILLTVQLLYDQLAPDQRDALTRARDAMLFPHKLLAIA